MRHVVLHAYHNEGVLCKLDGKITTHDNNKNENEEDVISN